MTELQRQQQQHNHNQDHEWTSIRIHRSTLGKLSRLGKFKETYAELIDRVVSEKLGLQTNPEEGSF